jgi:hypothetical protein
MISIGIGRGKPHRYQSQDIISTIGDTMESIRLQTQRTNSQTHPRFDRHNQNVQQQGDPKNLLDGSPIIF